MKLKVVSLFIAATAAFTATSNAVTLTVIGIANTSIGLVTLDSDASGSDPRVTVSGNSVFVSVTGGLVGGNSAIKSSMDTLLSSTTSTFANFSASLTSLLGTTTVNSPGILATSSFTNGAFQFSQANTNAGDAGNTSYLFLVALNNGFISGIGAYTGSNVPASGSLTFNPTFAGDAIGVGTSVLSAATTNPVQPISGFQLAAAVPEPSAVLLGALGALGLLRRRRN